MRSSIHTLCALLLLLPLTACVPWSNGFTAETTLTRHVDHVSGSALEIKTGNGRVEVVAAPEQTDVAIEARLKAKGRDQAEADQRLAATTLDVSRGADGTLIIKPQFPEPHRGGDGASITVMLPDAHGVNIDTGNGSVVATGLSGDLVIDTSNGPVKVTGHDGPARIDTSNGAVRVVDHVGSLWVDTSNGGIELENVDGDVTADTSNGRIEVTLETDQPGPLNLDTSNGSITVLVGQGFTGTVNLGTSNGSISVRDDLGRVTSQSISRNKGRIVVGEGGEPSRLDTSNGPIKFTIRG